MIKDPLLILARESWPDWLRKMNDEQRSEYFRNHPNSIYNPKNTGTKESIENKEDTIPNNLPSKDEELDKAVNETLKKLRENVELHQQLKGNSQNIQNLGQTVEKIADPKTTKEFYDKVNDEDKVVYDNALNKIMKGNPTDQDTVKSKELLDRYGDYIASLDDKKVGYGVIGAGGAITIVAAGGAPIVASLASLALIGYLAKKAYTHKGILLGDKKVASSPYRAYKRIKESQKRNPDPGDISVSDDPVTPVNDNNPNNGGSGPDPGTPMQKPVKDIPKPANTNQRTPLAAYCYANEDNIEKILFQNF